jgi:type I restriction enzyme, R subunit
MTLNEADTCRTYILPKLATAQWDEDAIAEQMVLTPGRIVPLGGQHTRKAGLHPDYVLFIRRNIPIAVVEAKADYKIAGHGLQQAMRYAEMLNVKFAYASNGKGIVGCRRRCPRCERRTPKRASGTGAETEKALSATP